MKTPVKILIWVLIIALVIFLTLFISSKIADYPSIGAMLQDIWDVIRSGNYTEPMGSLLA